MLRWLTQLFRPQRQDANGATSGAELAPSAAVIALDTPEPLAPAVTTEPIAGGVTTATMETRETCPDCGRTSVFAGPPGHRYCMHCALRQELFDTKTGAS